MLFPPFLYNLSVSLNIIYICNPLKICNHDFQLILGFQVRVIFKVTLCVWARIHAQYGDELLSKLTSLSIPAVIPKPTKLRTAAKCVREVVVENEENGIAANGSGKRRRTNPPLCKTRRVVINNPKGFNGIKLTKRVVFRTVVFTTFIIKKFHKLVMSLWHKIFEKNYHFWVVRNSTN